MTTVEDFWGGTEPPPRRRAEPMDGFADEIAGRLKEMFYAYTSRQERSMQATLGPSEIGSPCDRRLAMSLMRVEPVNPGGDNWAAFVGTSVHTGLAEMFMWANANSGRYAVEVPLTLPSAHVPRGTGDLLDRTLLMFADHKLLGSSTLSKLRLDGPSPRYRVQVHTYGYGARQSGEDIEHVAIIGWPREAGSLKGLYVWTEPYDESIAVDALARVDRIANRLGVIGNGGPAPVKLLLADAFDTADDCRFCPYHTKTNRGCNGHS